MVKSFEIQGDLSQVPPTGIEPVHLPPEGSALSPELRGLIGQYEGYQRVRISVHTATIHA